MTTDALSARLRATFIAELEEQTRVMNADLLALEREPADTERLKSLFRVAHTLKGAARATGVTIVEKVCHELESLLARARDGKVALDAAMFVLLFAAADALADAARRIAANGDLESAPLADIMRRLDEGRRASVPPERNHRMSAMPAKRATPTESPDDQNVRAQIRVDATTLDAVLAAAADLRQARARVVVRATMLRGVDELAHDTLARWQIAARRIRARLARSADAAPELRVLDDLDERLRALGRETSQVTAAVARDARNLAHAADEVAGGVVRLRMRPFGEICEALPRMVRDLAAEERKDVRITIQGATVEADRAILDALREPIVQLVRNAISHGVEAPERRAAAGKPKQGSLVVGAVLRGDRFVVTVADDGAGVDSAAVRQMLRRAGRDAPADDAGLARALLAGGVTTRAEASVISGRGIGLDLVRTAIERIGGAANMEWAAGRGTTFALDCPLTLASIRVVLVGVGLHTVAIPTASVERLLRVQPRMLERAEGRDVIAGADGVIPIVSLARVLGAPYVEHVVSDVTPAVQLFVAGQRLVALVDTLIDECEVTVRALDHGEPLPLVSGAAMIATGSVAPVLNATSVVADGLRMTGTGMASLRPALEKPVAKRRILVVDDSITTRTLEQSVLDAAGYDVATAVDGADAWRVLQEQPCDLVVSDVEMPRMDGFALCEAIRAAPRLASLPVILVTALETADQRARGLRAGADAYLGKSSFDQQTLLDVIREFLQ